MITSSHYYHRDLASQIFIRDLGHHYNLLTTVAFISALAVLMTSSSTMMLSTTSVDSYATQE
jgi:hypothetical protein